MEGVFEVVSLYQQSKQVKKHNKQNKQKNTAAP